MESSEYKWNWEQTLDLLKEMCLLHYTMRVSFKIFDDIVIVLYFKGTKRYSGSLTREVISLIIDVIQVL